MKWAYSLGIILVFTAFLMVFRSDSRWVVSSDFEEIFEEITSLEVSVRHITPDRAGKRLAYTRSTNAGLRLVVVNLESLERTEVSTSHDVFEIFGFSKDGRHLAFLERTGMPQRSWIGVYDTEGGTISRLSGAENVVETSFTWLSESSYFYIQRPYDNAREWQTFWGDLREGVLRRAPIFLRPDRFVAVTGDRAAFTYKSNIYGFPIAPEDILAPGVSAKIEPITSFAENSFDKLQWLRYCLDTHKYLFCARPEGATWRYLYRYDSASEVLEQLTDEDTYNGQFIESGKGFAYVGNRNNSFYLAVRPKQPEYNVDLFVDGSVVTYSVSPDGNRIYIHAAQGDEPHGIWEYSLETRNLRQVSSGKSRDFIVSRIIEPEEFRIPSTDGAEIPVFFFTPPGANSAFQQNRGDKGRRNLFPAVIYIPPNSAQMQRSFGPRSQFLANIGFYFLAVNYRGVDGYGRDYANSYYPPNAAQDILAAYEWLLKNPNVDPDNVFIFSMSGGTPICFELLQRAPQLWRGVAIDKPTAMPVEPRLQARHLPPLFLITGDQDEAMPSVMQFSEWAARERVDLQVEVYQGSGHITFDLESRRRSQRQVAEFFIRNIK